MENVLYIVILALLLGTILAWFRTRQSTSDFPYQPQSRLLTKTEAELYQSIQQTLNSHRNLDDLMVFAKVRIADVINPGKALVGNDWQDAYGRISSKHFDYVVCTAEDSQIRLIIELDDGNQRSVKKLRRDHFLDQICASASVPLLRIPAQQGYDLEALWLTINAKLLKVPNAIDAGIDEKSSSFQQKPADQGAPGA